MRILLIFILLLTGCASVRPWTTEEKVSLGASCLMMAVDIYTTMEDGEINEVNPLIGRHPSDAKFIGFMLTSQLLTTTLAHYWDDFRIWILRVKTFANFGCVIYNINH